MQYGVCSAVFMLCGMYCEVQCVLYVMSYVWCAVCIVMRICCDVCDEMYIVCGVVYAV